MNVTQRGIALLMKSAVTGMKNELPDGFALDNEETKKYIKKHQLIPLMYAGATNCGVPGDTPIMKSLFAGYCKYMIYGERQMMAAGKVFDAFEEAGIDYMPFKGYCMKALYPKPELRIMGDVDVLIRREDSKAVAKILEDMGFVKKIITELELVYDLPELHLEVHKRLYTHLNEAYYAHVWDMAHVVSGHRYDFSVEDMWVYIFNHFARHFSGGGIGCRHVIDLYVYRNHFKEMDEAYVVGELAKMGLDTFYGHTLRLLDVWFEDGASDSIVDSISEVIFNSGAWGSVASNAIAHEAVHASMDKPVGHVKPKAILRAVLPPRSILQNRYPVLKKWPVLLPMCWVARGIRVALFQHDDIRNQRKRWNTLEDEKVTEYQQFLRSVGLDQK